MRSKTTHYVTVNDVDCEVQHKPVQGSELTAQVGEKIIVAYLVYDNDNDVEDLMGDCMGKLYSFHRGSPNHADGLEALGNDKDGEPNLDAVWREHEAEAMKRYPVKVRKGYSFAEVRGCLNRDDVRSWDDAIEVVAQNASGVSNWDCVDYEDAMHDVLEEMWDEPAHFPGDKDAQVLACYEHGGQHWSLSGQGTQCRWDTSNKAGVFVPDACLRTQLDSDEKSGKDRATQARIYAQQFLDDYNDIIAGRVYGCVVETFDLNGDQLDADSCWGFIGDCAEHALKSDFFDPRAKDAVGDCV